MEKVIVVKNTEIRFVIWDVGGQREFRGMVPIACNDAVAILFMFDLTRPGSLDSIKEWFKTSRKENKVCGCVCVCCEREKIGSYTDCERYRRHSRS